MILVLLLCILPRSRSSISSNDYASIAFHEPWGFYQAESYDDTTGVWTESQGNIGRNANSVGAGGITTLSKKGHGASSEITSINGDTSSEILWPDLNFATWTVCINARYTTSTGGERILADETNGGTCNWGIGHLNVERRGAVYVNGYITSGSSVAHGTDTDWTITCVKSGGTIPGNVLVDLSLIHI